MASKVQKPCKICGKMFTPCADCENDKTMFRWKRVACSPKCAREYFAKIEASRQPKIESPTPKTIETKYTETSDVKSSVAIDNNKSRKTRKKNIDNEESEQID